MCALVQVCDAVHAGAHQELFCIDPLTHSATRKTNSKKMETAKPQKLRFGIFEDSQSSKLKIVASRILNRLRFDALLCSRSQSAQGCQAGASPFAASRCTATQMHS
jgi:hypothetical protein